MHQGNMPLTPLCDFTRTLLAGSMDTLTVSIAWSTTMASLIPRTGFTLLRSSTSLSTRQDNVEKNSVGRDLLLRVDADFLSFVILSTVVSHGIPKSRRTTSVGTLPTLFRTGRHPPLSSTATRVRRQPVNGVNDASWSHP